MDQKIVLNRLINSWSVTPFLPKTILLVGSNNIGRTTFAELVRKYVNNVQDDKLIFDNGKYIKQGVISNKMIKVQTIYPAVYERSNDQKELKVLDLPTLVFAPQNKKWSPMDQKITIQNLASKVGKVGFLLFINQSGTRASVTPWKKSLISFLDLFKVEALRGELLDSVAMIFTKATSEITTQTMVKRLQLFRGTLEKEKAVDMGLVDQLFKNLVDKKRLLLFKKVTKDESQKLQVIQNWKALEGLANCSFSKQMIKEIPLAPEAEKSLQEYFSTTQQALKYIRDTTKGLFQLETFTNDKLRETKNKRNQFEGQQVDVKKSIKSLFQQNNKKAFNYLQFIQRYIALSSLQREIREQNLIQLLEEIIKTGLFADPEDQIPFQLAIEGLQLRKLINFSAFSLNHHIQSFKSLFTDQIKESVFKKIILSEGTSEKKEYFTKVMDLMDKNFRQLPNSLTQFYSSCKKKLIRFSNPREALKIYIEQLDKQKSAEKIMEIACDIGQVLEGKHLFKLAGNVYRQAKQPFRAIKCLKQTTSNERSAEQYVDYLTELGLYEEATKSCYELYSQLGLKSRATFGQCLKNILEHKQKGLLKNVFQENPDKKNISQIKKLVQEAFHKI